MHLCIRMLEWELTEDKPKLLFFSFDTQFFLKKIASKFCPNDVCCTYHLNVTFPWIANLHAKSDLNRLDKSGSKTFLQDLIQTSRQIGTLLKKCFINQHCFIHQYQNNTRNRKKIYQNQYKRYWFWYNFDSDLWNFFNKVDRQANN